MGVKHKDISGIDAAAWESFGAHRELVFAVGALGLKLSARKSRLFACGVARCVLNWQTNRGYRLVIEYSEALADDQPPRISLNAVRRSLEPIRIISQHSPEYAVALDCLAASRSQRPVFLGEGHVYEAPEMAVFRDLVSNPFLSLTWNPDWFTSTVRDIASHIYAAHEFYSMRILADALQDAGCDDEQILTHCRGDRLHARGCWVLDAILGKS